MFEKKRMIENGCMKTDELSINRAGWSDLCWVELKWIKFIHEPSIERSGNNDVISRNRQAVCFSCSAVVAILSSNLVDASRQGMSVMTFQSNPFAQISSVPWTDLVSTCSNNKNWDFLKTEIFCFCLRWTGIRTKYSRVTLLTFCTVIPDFLYYI